MIDPSVTRTVETRDSRLGVILYREMVRIRRVEERIADLYASQEIRCPVHLCIGQEATAAGVCAALTSSDVVMSAHRSHGHYLAKGGDMKAMVAELYGRATGCTHGKGGSMHLIDLRAGFYGATPIVASTIPIAVGIAFAAALREEEKVIVVFFGEAATEEGAFHEAILFATLKKLPVVFVCENNLYSVYSPLSVRQPPERDLCAIAHANGLAAARGDGNDAFAVNALTTDAVSRARTGLGPSLLELDTYRWREHCGPAYDNHLSYRDKAEFEGWRERCPITTMRRRLLDVHGLDEAVLDAVDAEIDVEVDDAIQFARESPHPDPAEFTLNVYGSAGA